MAPVAAWIEQDRRRRGRAPLPEAKVAQTFLEAYVNTDHEELAAILDEAAEKPHYALVCARRDLVAHRLRDIVAGQNARLGIAPETAQIDKTRAKLRLDFNATPHWRLRTSPASATKWVQRWRHRWRGVRGLIRTNDADQPSEQRAKAPRIL